MTHYRQDRSKIAVLLLCALLAAMSLVSPICPACDGIGTQHPSHTQFTGKGLPATNEDCNGVCSCCGFQWLPTGQMHLPAVAAVTAIFAAQDERYPSRLAPPPFLPPRLARD